MIATISGIWRPVMAIATLAAVLALAVPAAAQRQTFVGDWFLSLEADRFGDGGTLIAVTASTGRMLAVRCIRREWSVAVLGLSDRLSVGDLFKVKFRADARPVITGGGMAINEQTIQINTTAEMVRQIREAREVAFRIETLSGITADWVFRPRQSKAALAPLAKECPLD